MFSSTQLHIQVDALLNLAYVAVITVIEYLPSLPEMNNLIQIELKSLELWLWV